MVPVKVMPLRRKQAWRVLMAKCSPRLLKRRCWSSARVRSGRLLDDVDEEIGLRFHACGASVAATRFCVCASGAEIGLHPSDGAGKAEVTAHSGRTPKDNPRFVITNLKTTPRHVYEAVYCARGDVENWLKELKLGLEIDRTSCTSFLTNQFRVLMSAAAYVLMQELRLKARRTGCGRTQVSTLRLRLLKLGAWIESSVRRLVIHLPIGTPFADDWRRIARSLGAVVMT